MNYARNIQQLPWLQILDKYRLPGEKNRPFAKRMGLNHGIITSWTKGDTPSVNIINKIKDKLQLSDKDYSNIMWLTNKVLVAGSSEVKKKIQNEMLNAQDLPPNHLCAILLSKKPEKQSVRAYVQSLGFPVERWIEMIQDRSPQLTPQELFKLLHSPACEGDINPLIEAIGQVKSGGVNNNVNQR